MAQTAGSSPTFRQPDWRIGHNARRDHRKYGCGPWVEITTRAPTLDPHTKSPNASTTPTPSWPMIVPTRTPANCRCSQANKGVGRFLNTEFRHRVAPDIADTVPDGCFHHTFLTS